MSNTTTESTNIKISINSTLTEEQTALIAQRNAMYTEWDNRIADAIKSVDHSMLDIAAALSVIRHHSLFKLAGYKNVYEYAQARYNISRGGASDAMNTFEAFGDESTGKLEAKYEEFSYSQLKLMRKLPVELLETVTPAITCRKLQDMINDSKRIEKSEDSQEASTATAATVPESNSEKSKVSTATMPESTSEKSEVSTATMPESISEKANINHNDAEYITVKEGTCHYYPNDESPIVTWGITQSQLSAMSPKDLKVAIMAMLDKDPITIAISITDN